MNCAYADSNVYKENLNIKIAKGSWTLIKGESGSGKSTLLDLCLNLVAPSMGEVKLSDSFISSLCDGSIGYVSQDVIITENDLTKEITGKYFSDLSVHDKTRLLVIDIVLLTSKFAELKETGFDIGASGSDCREGKDKELRLQSCLQRI